MTVIVVPCYNEAHRLDVNAFRNVPASVSCLFVDDGSTDETRKIVEGLCEGGAASSASHPAQHGKGRSGQNRSAGSHRRGCDPRRGYWDADLATPLDEIPRFIDVLAQNPNTDLVLGARINLLGRDIRRSNVRHYLGRIFATAASAILSVPVYDTQCGAKLFRVSDELRTILAEPFASRWIFDVELLARWLTLPAGEVSRAEQVYELPLQIWHDVGGSKIRPSDVLRAPYELLRIHARYFRST